ncbi:hypothetical protein [Rhizomicrobium electricum]|jgi:hypothetical protein|uniref:GtrA-like protein domain-containing protein n=1 Tax=Rhizomicrobium electricum TaxID=480070 RepID=A0ABN1EAQ9_9PROT|nr:hypothetical protein [Rhizomicrobium electricum]NIJ48089.1 hypothetical protein [Rhizomicrobium electricum]
MANDNVMVRGRRPLSIWILSIGNGLLAVFMIATSILAEDRGYSGGQAAFVGVTGVLISLAAHTTWYGYRWGRLALLILLTLFLGLLIVQSAMVISWANEVGYRASSVDAAMMRAGLSLVWLALNYIFLFGKRARMFFG